LDTFTTIFWWPGMNILYIPPLNGQRDVLTSWYAMPTRMPKDVYMSSMAMGILAWIATQVLLVVIMFGFICKGTARMFNVLFCGFFKWVAVLVCLIVFVLVMLSWTIFFVFNGALEDSNLCPGQKPFFPDWANASVACEGLWCSGFAGTAVTGGARYIWGPTAGWICAVCSSIFIFFILCVVLSMDPYRFSMFGNNYEEIGEKRGRKKVPKVRKRSAQEIKLARQRRLEEDDEEDSEDEERRPLRRGSQHRGGGGAGGRGRKGRAMSDIEEFANDKRKSGGRGRGRR